MPEAESSLQERLEGALPAQAVEPTARYLRAVQGALGPTLLSVVLYGSAVRGGYTPLVSDLNLMLVTEALGVQQLRAVAEPSRQARREVRLAPLFLTRDDLTRSTDVFPLLFVDMQERHVRLHGDDLLGDLVIRRDHMRLACELTARNMVLRLRQFYLVRGTMRSALVEVLNENMTSFVRLLHHVLELDGIEAPDDPMALLTAAAAHLKLDPSLLSRLWALCLGADAPDRAMLETLYEDFIDTVTQVATHVDHLSPD